VLAGGDDYELCFTAPPALDERVRDAGRQANVAVTPIGRITAEPGLVVRGDDGRPVDLESIRGFDHFAEPA
jgi:thiamine-monophosphate kinase